MALHVIPRHRLEHAAANARPWLPMFRALTKELEKYPEAELVEVRDANQHVRIRTHNGKLLIDVTEPDANVHVACPLAMMEDVTRELEAESPAA
jgi:hypothetical protein